MLLVNLMLVVILYLLGQPNPPLLVVLKLGQQELVQPDKQ
uniref:Uncharacterized protein n=1 Tax=Picea glauca TaxID=3330 RepID=A0A117NJ95_PICGL|nr:hypothetical protein ABT39_MTgene1048 [Picea glauca]